MRSMATSKRPVKKGRRKATLRDVETVVLANSARRCALCFHIKGDLTEKLGQIAHLDQDRSNSVEDNLAFMCLPHHSLYDSKTKQHKNYTMGEVKAARSRLYALVAEGNHLNPTAAQPYLQAEADKKVLRDFIEAVPSNGSIRFLRDNDFGGSFELEHLHGLRVFVFDRNGPEHEFLDPELEAARNQFWKAGRALFSALAVNTFPASREGLQSVPRDWREDKPQQFARAVSEIHVAADSVCGTYDVLVRLARKKLAI